MILAVIELSQQFSKLIIIIRLKINQRKSQVKIKLYQDFTTNKKENSRNHKIINNFHEFNSVQTNDKVRYLEKKIYSSEIKGYQDLLKETEFEKNTYNSAFVKDKVFLHSK